MRWKHGKQLTVDPEIKEGVRKFVKAIFWVESHNLRAQITDKFIGCGRSASNLYCDYTDNDKGINEYLET